MNSVFSTWFQLEELDVVDGTIFEEGQKEAMLHETEMLIDDIIWEQDGDIMSMFTANYTYVNALTAPLYGLPAPTEEWERVTLPDDRVGILTHPSLLASHGHGVASVYRGKFMRETFFCLGFAAPPNELVELDEIEGEPGRDRAERRIAAVDEGCETCHKAMEGLGLIFDPYDATGRLQEMDELGNALTFGGSLYTNQTEVPNVATPRDLAEIMVESDEVRECVSRQWFAYAFARSAQSDDACAIETLKAGLVLNNNNLPELLRSLVTSDLFRYKRVAE